MTRPVCLDGGRVVALGGIAKLQPAFGRTRMAAVAAVALAGIAACSPKIGHPVGEAADASVSVQQSAIVANPATWNNLWGSWPQQRYEHQSTYDTDRNLIVMYGGQQNSNGPYYGDTWEWNGTKGTWTQRTPTGKTPGARSGFGLAYDPNTKKTFLFSGWQPAASFFIPDQWEWDGTTSTWAERQIAGAQPSARHDFTMLYDPDRKKIVLFGGIDETGTRLNDVWDWDGTAGTWTQRTIAGTKPPARWGHTMVYDTGRKKFVVYGGNTGTGTGSWVNETWELDASAGTWQQFITTGDAPAYYYYEGYERLAHDPVTKKTVLYESDDYIYEWDPVTPAWKKVTAPDAATINTPNYYPTLTYDPVRAVIVVFAGLYQARQLWEFDTTAYGFTNRSVPFNGPLQRQNPALAFDTKRGKLMLFGGRSSADNLYKQDTWEWSGTDATWLQRTTVDTKPDARYLSAMVYDSKRDRLLLYGGTGAATYDDLWQWDPTTRTWSPITVSGMRPGQIYGHSMFYDAARDKVILFNPSGYTIWEYDPALNTWANRTQTPQPTILNYRSYYELAFDSDRGKLVMLGGYSYVTNVGYVYDTEVIEWDTTLGTWEDRPAATGTTSPVGRYYHAIAYDSARRVIVMYGGHAQVTGLNADIDDSWEWDGNAKTWTETTPPGVRPLPRENHGMTFDTVRGTTYMYGGSVPADSTYGPSEIWEYVPNSAPRPNGAGCTAASAKGCMSGNCVDGVCCAQTAAQCNGMCKACNVPGMFGTCQNVPAGSPDDTCASDQACDATQTCKARIGAACSTYADCATGHCADGVCCDTDCNGACMQCNLNSKKGQCSPVPNGIEDPGTCSSDPSQSRFCDGSGVCTNGPKANGKPCTASGQCSSTYCIDGFCCGSPCNQTCYTCGQTGSEGSCTPIAAGLPDHTATQTCDGATQYCTGSGTCGMDKKPNGQACPNGSSDCGSGFCSDGVCCNSACGGTCQSCAVKGKEGSCVNVIAGSQDLNSAPACNGSQYCDAAGTCQSGLKPNGLTCAAGTECGSNNCVDGVCCDSACGDDCYACNVVGSVGTCTGVVSGTTDGKCVAPNYCSTTHTCTTGKKANGTGCKLDNECGSGNCVDGVCCDSACGGKCRSCAVPGSAGSCVPVPDGMDLRKDCTGDPKCGGTCDGQGACRFIAAGTVCAPAGCQALSGLITSELTCDGAGHCPPTNKVTMPCNGFRCYTDTNGAAQCGKDCTQDPECAQDFYCSAGGSDGGADGGGSDAGSGGTATCPAVFGLGHACDRNAQCGSGTCSDGVCCNVNCDQCGSCNLPGTVGTCVPVPAGTDPNHDCINSASDPSGKCGGMCDGHAHCLFPSAGTTCGTCKSCNGSGLCNIQPDDDDACGTIDCDTLDTSCADYHDLTTKRCAGLGTCKTPDVAASCTDVTQLCGADGGAGTGGGGTAGGGSTGAGGGTGGGTGNNDGSSESKSGGGGGGCGCVVGGTGLGGNASALGLLLGAVLTARRRRRR
ncbi:MAG TPA: kelch repeat-containing protein [Polyangia bacterium]|nr:kelch repeat-containing protein [Polyangia bacterium]